MTAPDPIHHLAEAQHWQQALTTGEYRQSTLGGTLEDGGFIHCSTPQQVAGVLGRYYAAHDGDLVLLTIDPDRLAAPLRWDVANPATGEQFPHIYGPLNPDAVVATRVLHPPHAAAPQSITLRADGIELEVLSAGASVRRLRLGHDPATALDVVLGHADPQTYRFAGGYLGATIGRLANRLAGGSFTIDGETFNVPTNEGTTALHGGFNGFDRMPWHVTQRTDTRVRLTLTSPDGDNGFPGTVEVSVTYTVSPGQVRIDYTATTDRVTPFTITNHAYFNLDGEGSGTVDDHELEVTASAMVPINAANLPTGEIRPVEGTAFDLRVPRRVGEVLAADDEQLRRGERLSALGELASGIAHDFNNLLAGILGNTQLLLLDEVDLERQRMLRVVEQAAQDGATTVRRTELLPSSCSVTRPRRILAPSTHFAPTRLPRSPISPPRSGNGHEPGACSRAYLSGDKTPPDARRVGGRDTPRVRAHRRRAWREPDPGSR